MWRYILLLLGSAALLQMMGISRDWNWKLSQYPALWFGLGLACWICAVWGWRAKLALMSLGVSLIVSGAVLFFVMPIAVNAGSGQDAVSLIAFVAGGLAALAGLTLLAIGAVLPKPPQTD